MTVLVALGITVGITVALVLLNRAVAPGRPLDTELPERWLVRHAPAWAVPVARRIDRRIVGGAAMAAGLAIVAVSAVVVGSLFETIDDGGRFARWDEAAAEWGAEHATDASTAVLRLVTHLGGSLALLVLLLVVGLVDAARHRSWAALGYVAAVGLGVLALNNFLKLVVDRDRPAIAQLAGHSGSSFPSGHSAAAAACWAAIALVLLRRSSTPVRAAGAVAAVLIAVAVGATRVLLGVHWLTDVVAGVTVGWAWFGIVTLVFGGRLLRLGEPAERVARDEPAGRVTSGI